MPQRIVMCSDGTGNSFSDQVSNVARLVTLIDLSEPDRQVAFYDQGIGTNPRHVDEVKHYSDERPDLRRALTVLDPPYRAWWVPTRAARLAGLTVGYGLRRNVKELYAALAQAYVDDADIYLFGFSRGAFTMRVLAGLLFRCGLLRHDTNDFEAKFARAYDLYTPHIADEPAVERFTYHVASEGR